MTNGSIWKLLLRFSVPMAIGLLFQQLYNTVDAVVVGNFVGKEALAAVGSTGSITGMLVGLCAGMATGASVLVSQRYGAHDDKGLHDAVHTTISFTLILCVLMTLLGVCIVRPMLDMMSTPADVYGEAESYLMIYFLGISGLLLYNMGSAILQAIGDSRRPLYFLCFSAINNIIFDLLFVAVLGMGVEGAAYATILSQFLSAALVLFSRSVRRRRGDLTLLFLLLYGLTQAVLDSTRYDSLYLRSNGFVSVVQVLSAAALVGVSALFSARMIRCRGMRWWYVPLWLGMLALLGGAGYMEYFVQRHGDRALFSYAIMTACLGIFTALSLLTYRAAVKST